ncbi:glycosyltransferase family 4 protein [Ferruginibacter paludis]|uniref:glycosyltransferase family 4 protein n=1 Tax=Ferruginibacter paludis TaxID=1310417 RepID=UPI0025B60AAA|nr:glycosyltransferase family 4 protein [Ferruginibacter paludis]MDN3658339.1 glycosyltransferase family 4 protein [Ferruginibacter paludis]
MKILFYLRVVVMGGAERYLLTLLPELKKRNIEVGFFCTLQDNNQEIINRFAEYYKQYDIPVYICKASSPVSLKAASSLAKVIKKGNYSILSAHLIHAEIISSLSKIFFHTHCKLVVTKHGYLQKFMDVHGLDYTKVNRLSVSYQVEKFLQYFVADNFSVSVGLANFYIKSGICQSSKMSVIHHGLEPDFSIRSDLKLRHSGNQLLIIGRLRRLKGHHLLIKAVKLLNTEITDIKLIILGQGEEMPVLVKMVNEYNLNSTVIFAGYSDNVSDYIKCSDIVVAPSTAEAFGLMVLEAYSCAKPVVAFNVTAFDENIIDNETGCLVVPYSIEELAAKIKYLLQNKGIATQFGLNGARLLKNKFSLSEAIAKTIVFFEKQCVD